MRASLLLCLLLVVPYNVNGIPNRYEDQDNNSDDDYADNTYEDDDESIYEDEDANNYEDDDENSYEDEDDNNYENVGQTVIPQELVDVIVNDFKNSGSNQQDDFQIEDIDEKVENKHSGDEEEKEDQQLMEHQFTTNYVEDEAEKNDDEDESTLSDSSHNSDRKNQQHESPENIDANLKTNVTGDHPGDALGNAGDIMFRPGEEKAVFGNKNDQKADEEQVADISITHKRWPNGVVPYQIEGSLGGSARNAISAAITEFNAKSCIRLVPRSTHRNYISFYKGSGCWSYIGMSGGKQRVSLGSGCENKKTAIHEVMHALGFWHEQSRPDRDQYVTINWNNIEKQEYHSQFQKRQANTVTYLGHPYDYHSIMHYSKTAFGKKYNTGWFLTRKTKRRETITPKRSTSLGQCSTCGMSTIDASQLIQLYCSSPRTTVATATLNNELKMMMAAFSAQSNSVFRKTLLDHLKRIYPSYYWTVSSYNPVSGFPTHTFIGHCGHVWRYYNKNVVACYSRKNVRLPSVATRNNIANNVLASVRDKGCDAKWAAQTAWSKAKSYKYPISMVHNVRHGSGLRTQWYAHTYFWNYRCKRACRQTGFWWSRKTKCTDHKSSLILMFGSP